MSSISFTRRDVMSLAVSATAAATVLTANEASADAPVGKGVPPELDRFIRGYLPAMNAPGLTLALTNAQGAPHSAAYGYADIAAEIPVTPAHVFQIGSISKSFVGVLIMQLHDEGKLDLHKSILHYLPWLAMETEHGDVTVHHLLIHSSGMPSEAPLYPAAGTRPRQSFKPGTRFHYCNWGYDVLGQLVEAIDGRPWDTAVRQRIFAPLRMTSSFPTITSAMRPRQVQSYVPLQDDRPYPRHGALTPAGNLTVTTGAGCIASTPDDMARYMQMILNRGAGPSSRILSEESFKLFTTPHITAPDFGPGAAYGYGLAVDKLDGHTRLRHTGGMASFMSSMMLDMESGIGAFSSINAQQGYRPNPVSQYALQLLRARQERKPAPAAPPPDEGIIVANPDDYMGVYTAQNGRRLEIRAAKDRIVLRHEGKDVALQQSGADEFIADHPAFALYPLVFGRAAKKEQQAADSKPAVVELSYGSDSYAHANFPAAAAPAAAAASEACAGYYYTENPWISGVRVVLRRGRLWLGGSTPLVSCGNGLYRIGNDDWNPETAEFGNVVGGKAQTLSFAGVQLKRVPEEAA